MPVQARLILPAGHICRAVVSSNSRLLGRCSKLVTAASAVVMGRALLPIGWALIAIAFIMTGSLDGRGQTDFPFGGVRESARPNH
jgi:hypothetical protein